LTERERSNTAFYVFPFKVLLSPFKTFTEIAQHPDVKGIALIAALTLLATTGFYYAYSAKVVYYSNGIPTRFLSSNLFSGFITSIVAQEALSFIFSWLFYAGILFLIMRAFGQKGGSWRLFFILVGYALSIVIVQSGVNALLVATLPELHFSTLNTWPPSTPDEIAIVNMGIQETWGPLLAFQAFTIFNFPLVNIFDLWLLLLSVIIVKTFNEIPWGTAAMITFTAFILRFFLKIFLGF
jgi:hypothetical protein